jgi:hypothetical protein
VWLDAALHKIAVAGRIDAWRWIVSLIGVAAVQRPASDIYQSNT